MRVNSTRYLYVLASEAGICRVSASKGEPGPAKSLQYASDYSLTVVESVKVPVATAMKVKARAMEMMRGARVFGEWFKVTPEIACAALRLAMIEHAQGPLAPSEQ